MAINEEALKKVFQKNILYNCELTPHTANQVVEYAYGNMPLESFDFETKKNLSDFYEVIKHAYFLETKSFIPNIFAQLEV